MYVQQFFQISSSFNNLAILNFYVPVRGRENFDSRLDLSLSLSLSLS